MTDHDKTIVRLSADASARWPDLAFALLLVPATSYDDEVAAAAQAAELVAGLHATHDADALRGGPEDAAYREFYRSMGLKAAQVSTPVKQSIRVLDRGVYHPVSPVVDRCMAIEYRTLVSFQIYSAAWFTGAVATYRPARGDEPIDPGRGEIKTCKPGELILDVDGTAAHSCYYGNHRGALLGEDDGWALVRLMRPPGLALARFEQAVEEARAVLSPIAEGRLTATDEECRLSATVSAAVDRG